MKLSKLYDVHKLSEQRQALLDQLTWLHEAPVTVSIERPPESRANLGYREWSGSYRDAAMAKAVRPAIAEVLTSRLADLDRQLADMGVEVDASPPVPAGNG